MKIRPWKINRPYLFVLILKIDENVWVDRKSFEIAKFPQTKFPHTKFQEVPINFTGYYPIIQRSVESHLYPKNSIARFQHRSFMMSHLVDIFDIDEA